MLLSFLEVSQLFCEMTLSRNFFLVWTWNYSCPFWTSGLDCWISENVDIFPSRSCLQGCFRRHSRCHVCPVHSGAFWRYFVRQNCNLFVDYTAVIFFSIIVYLIHSLPIPTKLQNPTICGWGGWFQSYFYPFLRVFAISAFLKVIHVPNTSKVCTRK